MQIGELLDRLAKLFPNAAQQLQAWGPIYQANLREGPDLQAAFERCLSDWSKATPPKPAEIAAHLPQHGTDGGGGQGPTLVTHSHLSAKWADTVMRSEHGAKAVQHGFARELYIWAEKHAQQWPDDSTLRRLWQAEQRHQRRVQELREQPWEQGDSLRKSCLRLADAMAEQNEKLCKRYGAIHDQEAA